MRAQFSWVKDTAFAGFTLRDEAGLARSIVTGPKGLNCFYGAVFASGMPTSGPFATAQKAADWVAERLVDHDLVPAGSRFGKIPK